MDKKRPSRFLCKKCGFETNDVLPRCKKCKGPLVERGKESEFIMSTDKEFVT